MKGKCVDNMSTHYQKLLTCFEKWADDSACFLINETFCDPSFILQDDCFNSLTNFETNAYYEQRVHGINFWWPCDCNTEDAR